MKRLFFLLVLISLCKMGKPSDTIFFNQNWKITSKTNGFYYRVTDMDAKGFFYEGLFRDYIVKKNKIITSGCYVGFKKQGEFIEYFENGNIQSKGQYLDNSRSGLWTYNYPNGQLKMIVDFTAKYFNIVEFRDTLDNKTIDNGTGQCTIDVSVFGISSKLTAYFKDGNRDRKWVYIDNQGEIILIEKYKSGNIVSSDFKKPLWDKSILGSYLTNAYFNKNKYFITEKMACERDFDEKSVPFIKHLAKEINFSNSTCLTYLNSLIPIDAILCIAKDKKNNYYFGTANYGLVKFDSTFTYYNKKNSLIKGNYISKIVIDEYENIWFTYGVDKFDYDILTAGLACLSGGDVKIYNTKNSGLTSNGINDIAIDKNNVKWFATSNCVISYDDKKWVKHFNNSKAIRIIDTIKYKNKNEYLKYAEEVGSETISWETPIENANRDNQETFNQETKTSYSFLSYFEPPSTFINIDVIHYNNLFINSINSGCCSYNGTEWETISDTNQIDCLKFQLKNYQINEITQQLIVDFLTKPNYSIAAILPVEQLILDSNNSIWILADNKLLKIIHQQLIEFIICDERIRYATDGRFKNDFYYIFKDIDGSIWAGINSGIIKIE